MMRRFLFTQDGRNFYSEPQGQLIYRAPTRRTGDTMEVAREALKDFLLWCFEQDLTPERG